MSGFRIPTVLFIRQSLKLVNYFIFYQFHRGRFLRLDVRGTGATSGEGGRRSNKFRNLRQLFQRHSQRKRRSKGNVATRVYFLRFQPISFFVFNVSW